MLLKIYESFYLVCRLLLEKKSRLEQSLLLLGSELLGFLLQLLYRVGVGADVASVCLDL